MNLPHRLSETLSVEQVDRIAEELGDLPLALHLDGSYLTASPITASKTFLAGVKFQRLKQPMLTNEEARAVPTLDEQQRTSSLYAVPTIGLEQLDPAEQRDISRVPCCYGPPACNRQVVVPSHETS